MLEEGLGEEMHDAAQNGSDMPRAVEFEDDDTTEVRKIKELIEVMTSYARTERPTAQAVLQALCVMRP